MSQKASEKLQRFIRLLEEIFELDKADLDFGIYRIMNIRKEEIKKFLSEGLPQKVQEALAPFAADTSAIQRRIEEIEKQCDAVGVEVSQSKMADEYARLKAQLASGTDLSSLETDVYSALYTFFNRYYEEGDFISKRRYKEGVYAIPYEGEEVKLYWANADQYYIKTSENFRDYTFIHNGKKVHFRLVEATTEKNNNKESEKREFMLYKETPDRPDLKAIEEIEGELVIRFVYDIPEDKKVKWFEANLAAIKEAIAKEYQNWLHLLTPVPGGKNDRTVLEKHLSAYVAKNTFDYFIHKDLRGFLTRELDFFIKSEVIHLDDIDTTDEKRADSYLAKVRAIKRVGKIIIDFLAQIEDFQKKLWLKKKFVVDTNWCITLDKINEKFYPEIIANEAQIAEWRDLYAIHEIKGDLTTVGYSEPLTVKFLHQNQNLVLDTRHFSQDFKERLLASIDNIDEQTGGLLVYSENFQALQLLIERYLKKIKCIYFDPPYNTSEATFLYKNQYKHSSWNSMIFDRVKTGFKCLSDDGILVIAIDDEELYHLKCLLDIAVGADKYIGTIAVQSNPRGRGINSYFATSHDYLVWYAAHPENAIIYDKELTEEQESEYKHSDGGENYRLLPFRRSGGYSTPLERPNSEFPLFFNRDGVLFAVGGRNINSHDVSLPYETDEILMLQENKIICINVEDFKQQYPDSTMIMPVDTSGNRRVWRWSDREKILKHGAIGDFVLKVNGTKYVQLKDYIKEGRKPKTIWIDSEYDNSSHGTNLLKDIFGERYVFGYPKSIYAVIDTLKAVVNGDPTALIFDCFAGSGTTGHAVLKLNQDGGNRKYILVEMGDYFHTVTLPRMKKVIYSDEWKNGKPQNRNTGVSHIMKYITLESYEDTLANIELDDDKHQLAFKFGDEYLIHYMLDFEAKDSLLSLEGFNQPFSYKLKIIENNETKIKTIDLCETFNYLIGLSVVRQSATAYFKAVPDEKGEYEGAVRLERDDSGEFGFKQIEGKLPDGRRALIIWRTITDDLLLSNAALDAYFTKHRINPADREFDVIYVNGDNNLANLRLDEEIWKVQRIEPVFKAKMFEEAE